MNFLQSGFKKMTVLVNDNMFHSGLRQQVKNFVQNFTAGEDEINADVWKVATNSLKSMKAPGLDGI